MVSLGDTLRLVAKAFDENGHRVDGATFAWSSNNGSVASVGATGLVTGLAEGRAAIMAAVGDVQGTSEITVENPDRAALVALYRATGGHGWNNSENWLTDRPLDTWHGVSVDAEGRVSGVTLWRNNLSRSIPQAIRHLKRLKRLDLGSNELVGPVPSVLAELTELEFLQLSLNGLEGSIPPQLAKLEGLVQLLMRGNNLIGNIPPELGQLQKLLALTLGDNQLSGPIPRELGKP